MKKIVTALVLITLIASCRKQDQEPVYGVIQGKLLKQVNVQGNGGFYKLTYDEKKRLTRIESSLDDVYYSYTGDIVKETRQLKNETEPSSVNTFPIKNNRVEEYTYEVRYNGALVPGVGKNEYNADGTVSKETRIHANDKYETFYIWENQNMVKAHTLKNGNSYMIIEFGYSDKANTHTIDILSYQSGVKIFQGKQSAKMRNKITQTIVGQSPMSAESTYQLDGEGYVLQETVAVASGPISNTMIFNYTY